jgi:hypothetical protein
MQFQPDKTGFNKQNRLKLREGKYLNKVHRLLWKDFYLYELYLN